MWDDLMRAMCLMLVFEGLLPAVAPQRWRMSALALAQTEPATIRKVGIVCMLAGAGMLYLIH